MHSKRPTSFRSGFHRSLTSWRFQGGKRNPMHAALLLKLRLLDLALASAFRIFQETQVMGLFNPLDSVRKLYWRSVWLLRLLDLIDARADVKVSLESERRYA